MIVAKKRDGPKYVGSLNEPYITRGAITFLEKILTKDMMALEYGCGTSTAWYAKRVKHLTCIEDNHLWADHVREELESKSITNVDLKLLRLLDEYFEFVDRMGNLDFVAIDGRRRCECIFTLSYAHLY